MKRCPFHTQRELLRVDTNLHKSITVYVRVRGRGGCPRYNLFRGSEQKMSRCGSKRAQQQTTPAVKIFQWPFFVRLNTLKTRAVCAVEASSLSLVQYEELNARGSCKKQTLKKTRKNIQHYSVLVCYTTAFMIDPAHQYHFLTCFESGWQLFVYTATLSATRNPE